MSIIYNSMLETFQKSHSLCPCKMPQVAGHVSHNTRLRVTGQVSPDFTPVALSTPFLDHKVLNSWHLLIALVIICCVLSCVVPPVGYSSPITSFNFHTVLPKKAAIILIFTKEGLQLRWQNQY